MQINGFSGIGLEYRASSAKAKGSPAAKAAATVKTAEEKKAEIQSIFEKYIHVPIDTSNSNKMFATRESGTPLMQLREDYQNWKAQQPPRTLPGSKGMTDENLAYLREHFSGELSAMEMYDLTETLVDMGIMTQAENNAAYGNKASTINIKDPSLATAQVVSYGEYSALQYHEHDLSDALIVSCRTLVDLFAWLGKYREALGDGISSPEQLAEQKKLDEMLGINGEKKDFWEERAERQEEFQELREETEAKRRAMERLRSGEPVSAAELLLG